MTRLRLWIVTVASAMGIVCQLRAQAHADTPLLCWQARPAAGCRAFVLTNFGVYADITGQHAGRLRALGDWGLMVNVTARDAVGASFFLSLKPQSPDDGGAWQSGPALRYRHWTSPRSALDLAVGYRGPTPNDQGAVFGLVKYSPTPLIGVALRPEVVQKSCPVGLCCVCNQTGWVSSVRVLAGLELAEVPGLVVPAIGAAVGGLIYALIPKRII
jgi:hypothetical protein